MLLSQCLYCIHPEVCVYSAIIGLGSVKFHWEHSFPTAQPTLVSGAMFKNETLLIQHVLYWIPESH